MYVVRLHSLNFISSFIKQFVVLCIQLNVVRLPILCFISSLIFYPVHPTLRSSFAYPMLYLISYLSCSFNSTQFVCLSYVLSHLISYLSCPSNSTRFVWLSCALSHLLFILSIQLYVVNLHTMCVNSSLIHPVQSYVVRFPILHFISSLVYPYLFKVRTLRTLFGYIVLYITLYLSCTSNFTQFVCMSGALTHLFILSSQV